MARKRYAPTVEARKKVEVLRIATQNTAVHSERIEERKAVKFPNGAVYTGEWLITGHEEYRHNFGV
jgi:limonene-1,2-epoxide hydrolase